jgi:hypothetical protein
LRSKTENNEKKAHKEQANELLLPELIDIYINNIAQQQKVVFMIL